MNDKFPRFFLRIGLSWLIGACLLTACMEGSPAPDPHASATKISPPVQFVEHAPAATHTVEAGLVTPTLAATQINPSLGLKVTTPQAAPTLDPTPGESSPASPSPTPKLPLANIRIQSPGPLSRVVSPFDVEASVIPGENGIVRVELIGEDGRAITRQVLQYNTQAGQRFLIHPQIAFEIPSAGETARLQVSVEDESHRITSLASVDLILLSLGTADLNPVSDLNETYILQFPTPDESIAGGLLPIVGIARSLTDHPLLFELYNSSGELLGSTQVMIQTAADEQYTAIQTEISYHVSKPDWARLIIHQTDSRISGDVAVVSQRIYLKP